MSEEHDKAVAEFLANGGKIQYGAYRESGRVEGAVPTSPWGAKKAGRPPANAEVDPTVEIEDEED
jgi:hypothetical protein